MNPSHRMDFFEFLPNSLLFLIVSFLPFKEAARTSILSKRWRNIWLNTSKIEFYESDFVNNGDDDDTKAVKRRVFMEFVSRWTNNFREPKVVEFFLTFANPKELFNQEVLNCIRFAITRSVKVLCLDFSSPSWNENDPHFHHEPVVSLPEYVYGHKMFESLKLFSCAFQVQNFIDFRVLKSIYLGWMPLSLNSITTILKNCPILEIFALKKCWNIPHLDISIPNLRLKSLTIDKCCLVTDLFNIEAPNLEFFYYSGTLGHFHINVTHHLKEVYLDFCFEEEFDLIGELVYNMLNDLYPASILTLCSYTLQVLPNGNESVKMQDPINVRKLILNTAMNIKEFCGINFLLHSSPYLGVLICNIGPERIFDDYEYPYEFTDFMFVPDCVQNTLRIVEVNGFTGTNDQILLLRFFVTNGKAMEQLKIQVAEVANENGNRNLYLEKAEELLKLRKKSRNLEILIT